MQVGIQGEPEGSYSSLAAKEFLSDYEIVGADSFFQAAAMLSTHGMPSKICVPVVNSTTGAIKQCHDALAGLLEKGVFFSVQRELGLPIRHQLVGVKGSVVQQIQTIKSHFAALDQTKQRRKELGILKSVEADDTAGSIMELAKSIDQTVAALGPPGVAARYDTLEVLESDFVDDLSNTTRFLLLEGSQRSPEIMPNPSATKSTVHLLLNTDESFEEFKQSLSGVGAVLVDSTNAIYPIGEDDRKVYFLDLVHPPGGQYKLTDVGKEFTGFTIMGSYVAHPTCNIFENSGRVLQSKNLEQRSSIETASSPARDRAEVAALGQ